MNDQPEQGTVVDAVPKPKMNKWLKWGLIGCGSTFVAFVLLIVLLGIIGLIGRSNRDKAAGEAISVIDVWNEFEKDEAAADEKYMHKEIKMTGTVDSVEKGRALNGDEEVRAYLSTGDKSKEIVAFFDSEDTETVLNYSKGQKITFMGEVFEQSSEQFFIGAKPIVAKSKEVAKAEKVEIDAAKKSDSKKAAAMKAAAKSAHSVYDIAQEAVQDPDFVLRRYGNFKTLLLTGKIEEIGDIDSAIVPVYLGRVYGNLIRAEFYGSQLEELTTFKNKQITFTGYLSVNRDGRIKMTGCKLYYGD